MQLFDEYITPLTTWLYIHPSWALFLTFLISFAESLAIVGSIVPGSVTMTAIGILAGTGVMRIDLTYLFAILGAIAGDTVSYELGYYYRESITRMWPFRKYPKWLIYGKDYFAKHGGKSVLIGRFAGPLRSIIPLIAGMLGMQQWRFLIANIVSAIGWSILYVTPGVLIGTASSELSTESATRLCILILLALIGIWLATIVVKWCIGKIGFFLQKHLQRFLNWLNKHPYCSQFFHYLTPKAETNNYPTAALVLLFSTFFFLFLTTFLLTVMNTGPVLLNTPLHLLMQSIRVPAFDTMCIILIQTTSTITLSGFVLTIVVWFSWKRNYKTLASLATLLLIDALLILSINLIIRTPWPELQLVYTFSASSCPAINLLVATSLFTFFAGYMHYTTSILTSLASRYILMILVVLSGIASLYLGEYWLTDILISWLAGISSGLGVWIIYRKNAYTNATMIFKIEYLIMLLIVLTAISTAFNFKKNLNRNLPATHTFLLSEPVWWDQQQPLLPLYRNNRIGKKVGLMNVQYVGSITNIRKQLQSRGWENYSDTLFIKLLKRTNGKPEDKIMPLLPQLYENKYPKLVMTWEHNNPDFVLIFSLWQSGYYLNNMTQPIWIGSVQLKLQPTEKEDLLLTSMESQDPLSWLIPSLEGYTFRRLSLPVKQKPDSIPTLPDLLLIKE